jgi:hypothetical protein
VLAINTRTQIQEVRYALEEEEEEEPLQVGDSPSRSMFEGAAIFFGTPKRINRTQILEQIPEKREVDRLVANWFTSLDPFNCKVQCL